MTDKNYLTKEGYDKLQKELNILKTQKLPEVLQRLKDAIGQGDISENAEYETAMAEKDLVEARINELEELLENVEIIEDDKKGKKDTSKEIRYGSVVKYKDDKGKIYQYTIVGSGEVDVLAGTISFDSPLGMAIKGKKKGDIVVVKAPRGRYSIEILDVK